MNDLKETAAETPAGHTGEPPAPAPDKTSGDRYIRASAIIVVTVLAGVAMFVSYRHQYELAIGYGEPAETARLFPITIDGAIIMASLIMLYCARLRLPVPGLARLGLWAGIVATLVANAAHGWDSGWGGRLVSAAPAAVLVIAYELLMWLIRTMRQTTPQEVAERVVYRDVPVEVPVEVAVKEIPADRFEAARWAYEASIAEGRRPTGRRALADRWGIEIREAVEIIDAVAQERREQETEEATAQGPAEPSVPEGDAPEPGVFEREADEVIAMLRDPSPAPALAAVNGSAPAGSAGGEA